MVLLENNKSKFVWEYELMHSFQKLGKPMLLLLMAVAINSCANMNPQPSQNQNQQQNIYYTTPPVTFMREFPKYDSSKVAAVYRGDQVTILSKQADDWCMVQAVQSGKIGWIQTAVLSPEPIPTPTYFVQVSKVRLQDAPQKNAASPEALNRGDKVRKLGENQEGWWMVLAEKDRGLGWIPASALSAQPPVTGQPMQAAGPAGPGAVRGAWCPQPASKQLYYVATDNLNLHSLPLVSSDVVNTLKFNDRVEKIGQSDSRWVKVRNPATGTQGWAQGMFLADASLKTPKTFTQHVQPRRRAARRPECAKPAEAEKTPPAEKASPEEAEPVVL
jgi:uncharacterized protein YgiM (DUF1202 family)